MKGENVVKKCEDYESVRIEIVNIEESDVITTSSNVSTDKIGDTEGRFDYDGWT